jgi:hypothetical protein
VPQPCPAKISASTADQTAKHLPPTADPPARLR